MTFDWFPFTLGWEITLACNLKCKHCGSSASQPRKNELTTQEALQLCDQFPALLVQEVDFTGGEPLLRDDWTEIALRLKKHKITTGMVTNGILLNDETITNFKKTGISHVAVSIDGLPGTHDLIRGKKGLFHTIIEGIRKLKDAKIPVTIITTVTRLNIDELPELFNLLNELGIKRWRPQPLIASGRGADHTELMIGENIFLRLVEFYQEWEPVAGRAGIELLRADGLGYFFKSNNEREWHGCPAGLVSVGITSDGMVKGCLSLPDRFIEGDLRKNTLWDIWFDKNAFPYARQYAKSALGENCKTCEKAEQCRGGCAAMSFGYSGKFHNDPLCHAGLEFKQLKLNLAL